MKCNNRIKRIEHLEKIPSKIKKLNSNMFGYEYIEGDLLSNITDTKIFSNFLEQFYEFTHTNNICDNLNEFRNNCTDMYKIKTYERIKKFKDKEWDKIDYINGVPIKPIINILNEINWEEIISNAIPANFHGDLQPENIIITKDKKIVLIDWRESFGSDLKIGDFYYDLSKLYHGLIINGTIAKEKKFLVRLKQNRAEVSYLSKNNLLEFNKILESFCKKYEIDYEKVKLLGILHYINIAEFYEETEKEYSKFIFLLGKLLMSEILSEKRDKK